MSTSKRLASSSSVPSVKRAVSVSTVQKWIRENDRVMQMITWLKFKKCQNGAGHVANLSCSVCQEFDKRLQGLRNYSDVFVVGATNLQCLNFKDHAKTEIHSKAMSLYQRQVSVKPQSLEFP